MTESLQNPDQPVYLDEEHVARFKANTLVRYLLDRGGIDLNHLAGIAYLFPRTDWEQFYQLIGYSVSGYGDLSGVSQESVERADRASDELEKIKT